MNLKGYSLPLLACLVALCNAIGAIVEKPTEAERLPEPKLRGAEFLVEQLFSRAVYIRTKILLAVTSLKLGPLDDAVQSPNYYANVWKVAAYYCLNLTEAKEDYKEDLLKDLWNHGDIASIDPEVAQRRQAVIEMLNSNPLVLKALARSIAIAATGTTPGHSNAMRQPLLHMTDVARAYLINLKGDEELRWYQECQGVIFTAKKSDDPDAYLKVCYRFNQFGPGKFKEGALPSTDRWIETFVFRRLLDGMSEESIMTCINVLTDALANAPK